MASPIRLRQQVDEGPRVESARLAQEPLEAGGAASRPITSHRNPQPRHQWAKRSLSRENGLGVVGIEERGQVKRERRDKRQYQGCAAQRCKTPEPSGARAAGGELQSEKQKRNAE